MPIEGQADIAAKSADQGAVEKHPDTVSGSRFCDSQKQRHGRVKREGAGSEEPIMIHPCKVI